MYDILNQQIREYEEKIAELKGLEKKSSTDINERVIPEVDLEELAKTMDEDEGVLEESDDELSW